MSSSFQSSARMNGSAVRLLVESQVHSGTIRSHSVVFAPDSVSAIARADDRIGKSINWLKWIVEHPFQMFNCHCLRTIKAHSRSVLPREDRTCPLFRSNDKIIATNTIQMPAVVLPTSVPFFYSIFSCFSSINAETPAPIVQLLPHTQQAIYICRRHRPNEFVAFFFDSKLTIWLRKMHPQNEDAAPAPWHSTCHNRHDVWISLSASHICTHFLLVHSNRDSMKQEEFVLFQRRSFRVYMENAPMPTTRKRRETKENEIQNKPRRRSITGSFQMLEQRWLEQRRCVFYPWTAIEKETDAHVGFDAAEGLIAALQPQHLRSSSIDLVFGDFFCFNAHSAGFFFFFSFHIYHLRFSASFFSSSQLLTLFNFIGRAVLHKNFRRFSQRLFLIVSDIPSLSHSFLRHACATAYASSVLVYVCGAYALTVEPLPSQLPRFSCM